MERKARKSTASARHASRTRDAARPDSHHPRGKGIGDHLAGGSRVFYFDVATFIGSKYPAILHGDPGASDQVSTALTDRINENPHVVTSCLSEQRTSWSKATMFSDQL
jgi:hypothetical protein